VDKYNIGGYYMLKHHFVGKLTLTNRIDKIDYCVITKTDRDLINNNITNILNEIYYSNSPYISIELKTLDNSIKLIHKGELNIQKDKWNVLDYCVDNFALGLELFNLTNKDIDITIKHLDEKEFKKEVLEVTS
jgi:D-lyxose ketol-isomerase